MSPDMRGCHECDDTRRGTCAPFSRAELERELGRLQAKKAPGPEDLANEMLRQLGPAARTALLVLISSSWLTGEVPRQCRAAKIVHIPKSGKDKKLVSSYRPIALTSHLWKLAERLSRTASGGSCRRCRTAGSDPKREGEPLPRVHRSTYWWPTTSHVPTTSSITDCSVSGSWSWACPTV